MTTGRRRGGPPGPTPEGLPELNDTRATLMQDLPSLWRPPAVPVRVYPAGVKVAGRLTEAYVKAARSALAEMFTTPSRGLDPAGLQ
jgi:hypothetical protein